MNESQIASNESGGVKRPEQSWIRLLVLFSLAGFIEAFFNGHLTAFSPLYIQSIGVPVSQVPHWTGLLASISAIIGLWFLPLWGALADRFARKPFIIRSFLVHMVVGTVMSLAGNVYLFVFGRAIASMAFGDSSLMMTSLAERTPSHRQSFAFSIFNSTAPIGVFVGPFVGGWVIKKWGFPVLLWLDVILLAAVVLALFFGYSEPRRAPVKEPILRMIWGSIKIISRSRLLIFIFSALCMIFSGWVLANTFISLAINKIYTGNDLSVVVGIILGIGGLLALGLSPFLGMAADKFGRRKVLIVILSAEVILFFAVFFARNIYLFGGIWAVINGLNSGLFALPFTLIANAADENIRGRVMSLSYLPFFLGQILGPSLGSVVAGKNPLYMFPLAAGFFFMGLILFLFTTRRKTSGKIA